MSFEISPVCQLRNITNAQSDMAILSSVWPSQFKKELLNNPEKEVINKPYKGNYEIQGVTAEGWKIQAIICGSTAYEDKKCYELWDLCIDYASHLLVEPKTQEIVYGLVNIQIKSDFIAEIIDTGIEVDIKSIPTSKNNDKSDILSAEMTLRNVNEHQQDHYEVYAGWLIHLLSFASGHEVKQIYNIKTLVDNKSQVKIEYWSGLVSNSGARSIASIAPHHLSVFIQQCTQQMTQEKFDDKGLGLGLSWYIDTFSTTVDHVKFLLFCTTLESLRKKYVVITKQKEVGFKVDLKNMFVYYKVPYLDLFPGMEFVNLRNDIIHEGFSNSGVDTEVYKLSNLVVRVFLAILEYSGDYREYKEIDLPSTYGIKKYEQTPKRFPLVSP